MFPKSRWPSSVGAGGASITVVALCLEDLNFETRLRCFRRCFKKARGQVADQFESDLMLLTPSTNRRVPTRNLLCYRVAAHMSGGNKLGSEPF
jgi:hypothetical protein